MSVPTNAVRVRSQPPALARAGRALSFFLVEYRRTWRGSIISGFGLPLLYLASMGLGLGGLVDQGGHTQSIGGVPYLDFLAPGLLAATTVSTAIGESTYPVLGAFKWERSYYAMLATPLRVKDVLLAHLSFLVLRLAAVAGFFLLVIALFGAVQSWWGLLMLPVGVLVGMSCACPTFALSASIERDTGFSLVFRFGLIPMFLFSGAFFPVSQLPELVRPLTYVTPLYHGVELCRGLSLGGLQFWPAVGHLLYLGLWVGLGGLLAYSRFRRRLVV